jgi:transposase-like protein/IS1 family transposase
MDPTKEFCPNPDCAARGQVGKGNIVVHSKKETRYKCTVCKKTFTETKGTAFYRLRKDHKLVEIVASLLSHGCPTQAIVFAFGWDERTVMSLEKRTGQQGEAVQKHLVEKPQDLGQVQADEIKVKEQGKSVWMAMAIAVKSRLWVGGVISEHRDLALIVALLTIVKTCASALGSPLYISTDGFAAYLTAMRLVFREPIPTGKKGRPRFQAWSRLLFAQVIKQYSKSRLGEVFRRIVQGTLEEIEHAIHLSQGKGVINTSFIERLNATFRSRLAALVRKGRALARTTETLHYGMYLVGTIYNFCTCHDSLRIPGLTGGRKWLQRTPAMAAGITDHQWSVHELLTFKVPPPPWSPPKRRGRVSNEIKQLVERWCSLHD